MTASPSSRPELAWGMFCDYFMVDANGKYSFVGIFERIGAISFPAVHKVLYLICSVQGPANRRSSAVVNIWTPEITLLISTQESAVQFNPDGRAMLVHILYDLNFSAPGVYKFALEIDGRPTGEMKLDIYQAQPPAVAG